MDTPRGGRDFAAAMYADGAGIGAVAPYTIPSWDFRSVYGRLDFDPDAACSCSFPLAVRDPASGVAEKVDLAGGGAAAYVRMGVPANAFAGVEIRSGSAAPPATTRIAIIRRK